MCLRHVQRGHTAQSFKRLVALHPLVVGVLDVEARDVVGQQHNLVREQTVVVGVGQSSPHDLGMSSFAPGPVEFGAIFVPHARHDPRRSYFCSLSQ